MNTILIGLINFYFLYIFYLLYYMFTQRKKAVIKKEVHPSRFKSYTEDTTQKLQTIKNHIENQFQVPVIFFIACLLSLQMQSTDLFTVIVATIFVLSRLVHSFIHLGSNKLLHRAFAYMIGLICVALMFMQSLIYSL